MKGWFHRRRSIVLALMIFMASGLAGCTGKQWGEALPRIAPKGQMLTTLGADSEVHIPPRWRNTKTNSPILPPNQVWHVKYLASWEKPLPDPSGWSLMIPQNNQPLKPGESRIMVDGFPMICGNRPNEGHHPMDTFYFVASMQGITIRNARPVDFQCKKNFQEIWDYRDTSNAQGMKPDQTVLHTYAMIDWADLSIANFRPRGPFECRIILNHYKVGQAEKADMKITVYTERDTQNGNVDDYNFNIRMKGVAVQRK